MKKQIMFAISPNSACLVLRFTFLALFVAFFGITAGYGQRKTTTNTPTAGNAGDQNSERLVNTCLISTANGYRVKPGYKFVQDVQGKVYVALKDKKKPGSPQSTMTIQTRTRTGLADEPVIIEVWCSCEDYVAGGACTMVIEGDRVYCESNLDANDPCTRCEKHRKILIPNLNNF